MAGEWRETSLDRLGRIVTGKTPPSTRPEYFGGDIPFVTPSDFDGRRVIGSTGRYLTEDGAESLTSSRIPAGAVMVSCIGSDMGKAAVAGRDCVTNQQINSLVIDSGDDSLFVYYNLSTRKAEIRSAASGSAQPILNKSAFGRLDILLPSPEEQRAIAHILGTLDDKIELNRRMNETLEAMARALFQSWFVDFDPVRAKMDGRDPGLPKEIVDLFPDRFEDSELGEIPAGWEAGAVGDLAEVSSGKRPDVGYPEASVEACVPLWGGNGPMAFVSKSLIDYQNLLTGRVGTLGSVFRITSPCWPSDNTLVLKATHPRAFEYLFLQLKRVDFASLNRGSTQPL
jgi:type I restriction enzyme S subunit